MAQASQGHQRAAVRSGDGRHGGSELPAIQQQAALLQWLVGPQQALEDWPHGRLKRPLPRRPRTTAASARA
jgi:hypothetical protein